MFKDIGVLFSFISLILAGSARCMECDYRFLNKRAKAYAIAVVGEEEINEESMINDLRCMNIKFDALPEETDILQILQHFTLPSKASDFCDKGMCIYRKLKDPVEKGKFLLLLGGILSEIARNVNPISIASGPVD